ncbi:histone-lysine N-methyltransferase SUVR5-like [Lotus japonicus]|uniref:histone-lysine N-methyltransferase SUVR5-like n=1 Tax=Lotus japonicus TaxID=34305 RepID=UPI0025840361|nr:histone-lysine N-methyltransferase SUVR5-like [Lotus japonicus]
MERLSSNTGREGALSFSEPTWLKEEESMALWVKWSGTWQAGIKCARADCPLSTLKAKPTHEMEKYFVIFFPGTKYYSWVDMLLVRPINEFPQPIAYKTHQEGLKMVEDLTVARRFIMKKLAVSIMDIVDQLHSNALIETACGLMLWKELAKEASRCNAYSDLGRMLLKLQNSIAPRYISAAWVNSSFHSWVERCKNTNSAESVELLKEELSDSILWSYVNSLCGVPVQPKLASACCDINILSIIFSACCKVSLQVSLEEKYGILPESLCLKVEKLCSEYEVLVNWLQDGFICPKGCKVYELDRIINSDPLRSGSLQKGRVLCDDISFGLESIPVIWVEYFETLNSQFQPPWGSFTYVTKPRLDQSLSLRSESLQLRCNCSFSTCCPETCNHVYLFDTDFGDAKDVFGKPMRQRFPYDENGRIILEEGYLVYECNHMCRCNKTCPNKILQNGIRVKLEVFKTEKKGWGVRAGEAILRGTFICELIGEVLDEREARDRRKRYGKEHCSYFYDIDARFNDMGRMFEGESNYVIDATRYGNVSRFINSSCSPNLMSYQVLVESMDCKRSHIGLYASQDIALGEELTFDYRYKLVPGEGAPCLCGSSKCRGRLY